MDRSVEQLRLKHNIPMITGTVLGGKRLEYRPYYRDKILKFLVAEIYQRLIDDGNIKKYGQLNPQLLTSPILAERPDGKIYIIDGQTRSILVARSGMDDVPLNCLVYVHDKNSSIKEMEAIEAKIYKSINSNLKTLTTLDKIRSGVVFEDPESMWVLRVMKELKLKSKHFGSEDDDALELIGFNQFYQLVAKSFPCGSNEMESLKRIDIMKTGLEAYKKMFSHDPKFTSKDQPEIYANILRGCVLMTEFRDTVLRNGQVSVFDDFMNSEPFRHTNGKTISKKIGANGSSNKQFLHDVALEQHKMYCSNHGIKGPHCIGDTTYDRTKKFGKKFTRVGE